MTRILYLCISNLNIYWSTFAVNVAVACDEDDADGEDGEGVLVVEPEHDIVRPRVLNLRLPVEQLLRVLKEAVHGVPCHSKPRTSHKEARYVLLTR